MRCRRWSPALPDLLLHSFRQPLQDFMRAKGVQRPLEVETRTLEELRQVLALLDAVAAGSGSTGSMITRIMLDNMTRRDPGAPGKRAAPNTMPSGALSQPAVAARAPTPPLPGEQRSSGAVLGPCAASPGTLPSALHASHALQAGWTSARCGRPWRWLGAGRWRPRPLATSPWIRSGASGGTGRGW